jgi:hypothetical protein
MRRTTIPPPPTRFGPSAVQRRVEIVRSGVAPPPTRFQAGGTAQASAAPVQTRTAPPPTAFAPPTRGPTVQAAAAPPRGHAPPPIPVPRGAGQPSSAPLQMKRAAIPAPPVSGPAGHPAASSLQMSLRSKRKVKQVNYDENSESEEEIKPKKRALDKKVEELARGKTEVGTNRIKAHIRAIGDKKKFKLGKDTYNKYKITKPHKRRLAQIGRGWHNAIVENEKIETIKPTIMFGQITVKKGSRPFDFSPSIVSNQSNWSSDKKIWNSGEKWTDYDFLCGELDTLGQPKQLATAMLEYLNSEGEYKTEEKYEPRIKRALDMLIAITHIAEESRTASAAKHARAVLTAITKGKHKSFTAAFNDEKNRHFSARFTAMEYRQEAFQLIEAKTDDDKYFSDESDEDY